LVANRGIFKADTALKAKDYEKAYEAAKISKRTAEEAFFSPDMLSTLYFPDEHKYAIYALPFIPVFFQLLSAVHTEWKTRRTQPKKQ
jgi:phosphatidylinositol glycan class S